MCTTATEEDVDSRGKDDTLKAVAAIGSSILAQPTVTMLPHITARVTKPVATSRVIPNEVVVAHAATAFQIANGEYTAATADSELHGGLSVPLSIGSHECVVSLSSVPFPQPLLTPHLDVAHYDDDDVVDTDRARRRGGSELDRSARRFESTLRLLATWLTSFFKTCDVLLQDTANAASSRYHSRIIELVR